MGHPRLRGVTPSIHHSVTIESNPPPPALPCLAVVLLLYNTLILFLCLPFAQALSSTRERGDKRALKIAKRKQVAMLNKFSEAIRGNLTKLQRAKIVSLVTIEVHARDVIEKLVKAGCSDVTAFDWLSQLR